MSIAFRCAGCGKGFKFSATYAGRRGRCTQCGTAFTVPVATATVLNPPPAQSPAPAAAPQPVLFVVNTGPVSLAPRRPRRKVLAAGGVTTPILAGLGAAALILVLAVGFREPIVAAAPGLAPLIPKWDRPAPRPAPAPVARADPDSAPAGAAVVVPLVGLIIGLLGMTTFVVVLVAPLLVPAILSQRGCLSTGRWAAMSGSA